MSSASGALLLPLLTRCSCELLSRGVNWRSGSEVQLYSSDQTSFLFHFHCLLAATLGKWSQIQCRVLALWREPDRSINHPEVEVQRVTFSRAPHHGGGHLMELTPKESGVFLLLLFYFCKRRTVFSHFRGLASWEYRWCLKNLALKARDMGTLRFKPLAPSHVMGLNVP